MMSSICTLAELLAKHCVPLEGSQAMSQTDQLAQLTVLPEWSVQANALERTFKFKDYYETIAFVNALAWEIHAEDHHPELLVTYNRCKVRWDTHSVGGVSINDFVCAAKSDALYASGLARQQG